MGFTERENTVMYKVKLRKERATWYWYVENPQGGGGGSNFVGTKKSALAAALRSVKVGSPYEVFTAGRFTGSGVRS